MARNNKRKSEDDERDIWEGLDPETDLDVNDANLIGEMLRQSSLHFRYSRLVSIAEEEMKFADETVKTIRSQIILEVGRDPQMLDGAKPTEKNVEAYYRTHPQYKAAKEVYLKANGVYAQLLSAIYALGHKKDMLQHLARYELSGLISHEPRLPADATQSEKDELKQRKSDEEGKAPKRKLRGQKKEQ